MKGKQRLPVCVTRAAQKNGLSTLGHSEWKRGEIALGKNIGASVAPSTAKSYDYWWRRFEDFCYRTGKESGSASAKEVAVFLSALGEEKGAMGGVKVARMALRHHFRRLKPDRKSPTEGVVVDMALKGMERRFFQPVNKKAPLKMEQFFRLLNVITEDGKLWDIKMNKLRLAAQISLMFCTFGRYEESAALTVEQVQEVGGDLVVVFKKGKTYQMGNARKSVIPSLQEVEARLDPVQVIKVYMNRLTKMNGGNLSGWLFPALRVVQRREVVLDKAATYHCVRKQFLLYVQEAGIKDSEGGEFSLHSMRRGGVSAAANAGAADHLIMKQMRVGSVSTVQRYASIDLKSLKMTARSVFAL